MTKVTITVWSPADSEDMHDRVDAIADALDILSDTWTAEIEEES